MASSPPPQACGTLAALVSRRLHIALLVLLVAAAAVAGAAALLTALPLAGLLLLLVSGRYVGEDALDRLRSSRGLRPRAIRALRVARRTAPERPFRLQRLLAARLALRGPPAPTAA